MNSRRVLIFILLIYVLGGGRVVYAQVRSGRSAVGFVAREREDRVRPGGDVVHRLLVADDGGTGSEFFASSIGEHLLGRSLGGGGFQFTGIGFATALMRRTFLMDQNRKSRMEKAEGSRENVRGSASESGSSPGQRSSIGDKLRQTEQVRGSEGEDLGTSSDRAMWESESTTSGSRGTGSSAERTRGGTTSKSERGGGITNRDLDREQSEQERLPSRGRPRPPIVRHRTAPRRESAVASAGLGKRRGQAREGARRR